MFLDKKILTLPYFILRGTKNDRAGRKPKLYKIYQIIRNFGREGSLPPVPVENSIVLLVLCSK